MDFIFIALKKDSYSKKDGENKYNDIIKIKENDKFYYRIYLNDDRNNNDIIAPKIFVQIPYDDNLLISLKQYTWTLDNTEGNREANAVYCKSEANKGEKSIKLIDILNIHGYDNGIDTVDDIRENDILDSTYGSKRKEYKNNKRDY